MTKSKYGHIRKRSNGTFRVYWQEYGDRKSQTFDTYNEAKKFLEIKKIKNHKGNQLINYEFFYYDVIVPTYNHISERTKYDYEKSWRILSKWIASKRIIDTDWQVVQHIMDKIKSPTQQLACFKFWRRMLNYAVLVNIIQHNPCNSLIKLKPIHHRTKYIYSKEELLTVLKKVNKTEFALPILLESGVVFATKNIVVWIKETSKYKMMTELSFQLIKLLHMLALKKLSKNQRQIPALEMYYFIPYFMNILELI